MFTSTHLLLSRCRSGITLLEMLLAVVILALLMAVTIALSRSFVYSSKITRCLQNQRQFSIAMHAYASDHQGKFPGFDGGKRSSLGNQKTLPAALLPYVKSPDIFACPGGLGRIFNRNANGWYDWVFTNQNDRSGYWHVYINPHSEFNPNLADIYHRNDHVTAPGSRIALHCYYTGSLEQCSHERGEINVLRLNGSATTYQASEYNRLKNYHTNFEKQE